MKMGCVDLLPAFLTTRAAAWTRQINSHPVAFSQPYQALFHPLFGRIPAFLISRKEEVRKMGIYVNPGNRGFALSRKNKYNVDKTGLIQLTNDVLGTDDCRIVVSRPRRFGKTRVIHMLEAYYSCGCDSRKLFHGSIIESDPSFEEHLNKYTVISLDIQGLFQRAKKANRKKDFPCFISEVVNSELSALYPDEVRGKESYLSESIPAIYDAHQVSFVMLLDEWDVIFREERHNTDLKHEYTEFLKSLFKEAPASTCFDLVYMTGILPIPKQETQSGLNNFTEYTMLEPAIFSEYVGFTDSEVSTLCQKFHMPLQEMKDWYEGYQFGTVGSVYCPASVVLSLRKRVFENHWKKTGAATELLSLMNAVDPQFQIAVRDLVLGYSVRISVNDDGIDLSDIGNLDTALTALVHLGYLTRKDGYVRIPNQEVTAEFFKTLKKAQNSPAYKIMARSKELLDKTLLGDADGVAEILQRNHDTYASVYTYNQENDLACVVVTSYSGFTEEDYTFHRELETGKGFADIVFLPRPGKPDKDPIIIELKWDQSADTAIRQIKERRYMGIVHGFRSVLLVGISYDKDKNNKGYKNHTCIIERVDNP